MADVLASIYRRRAELLRELAALDEQLAQAASGTQQQAPDEVLSLEAAAAHVGEPTRTFKSRLEYRKALVSRPGEYRLRFSRRALDRILADRLASNGSGR